MNAAACVYLPIDDGMQTCNQLDIMGKDLTTILKSIPK